eukprot:356348-Chlamydomonas_euryale.AAC.1
MGIRRDARRNSWMSIRRDAHRNVRMGIRRDARRNSCMGIRRDARRNSWMGIWQVNAGPAAGGILPYGMSGRDVHECWHQHRRVNKNKHASGKATPPPSLTL